MPNLRRFAVTSNKLGSLGIKALQVLKSLTHVDFSGCILVSDGKFNT